MTTDARIREIVDGNSAPLNHNEREIAGYESSGQFKTEDNLIMEMDEKGRRKIRFTPVPETETKEAMEQLILGRY